MSSRNGFTLIEIIIFIVVFTLGVVGIMTLFYNTLGKTSDPIVRNRSIQILQSTMEQIFNKKWDERVPNGGCQDSDYTSGHACDTTLSSISGPDAGETDFTKYDDIDDFVDTGDDYSKTKEWESSSLGFTSGYTIKITVTYADVNPTTGAITSNTTSKTDYKMITVELNSGALGEVYKITAVKANF